MTHASWVGYMHAKERRRDRNQTHCVMLKEIQKEIRNTLKSLPLSFWNICWSYLSLTRAQRPYPHLVLRCVLADMITLTGLLGHIGVYIYVYRVSLSRLLLFRFSHCPQLKEPSSHIFYLTLVRVIWPHSISDDNIILYVFQSIAIPKQRDCK